MVWAEQVFAVGENLLVLGDGVLAPAARQISVGQPQAGRHGVGMLRALKAFPVGQ